MQEILRSYWLRAWRREVIRRNSCSFVAVILIFGRSEETHVQKSCSNHGWVKWYIVKMTLAICTPTKCSGYFSFTEMHSLHSAIALWLVGKIESLVYTIFSLHVSVNAIRFCSAMNNMSWTKISPSLSNLHNLLTMERKEIFWPVWNICIV